MVWVGSRSGGGSTDDGIKSETRTASKVRRPRHGGPALHWGVSSPRLVAGSYPLVTDDLRMAADGWMTVDGGCMTVDDGWMTVADGCMTVAGGWMTVADGWMTVDG